MHSTEAADIPTDAEVTIADAEAAGTPTSNLITQLFSTEWEARQEETLRRRIRRARFPEDWTLESFPFKLQTGLKERQIRTFAQLDFIPKAENIVLSGKPASGKPDS